MANSDTRSARLALEREMREEESAFEMYGGDAPSPTATPKLLHPPSTSPRQSQSSNHDDDKTVVDTVDDTTYDPKEADPNLVEWDGPNDPENPQNFTLWKKIALTALVILLTVNVTFASSAPSTATQAIAARFHVSNEVAILVTSLFLLGYVFGPLVWAGLSENFGRQYVFVGTLFAYTLFTMGQPLAKNIETLLITRFFAGFFASAPLSNGGGFIADIWDAASRGKALAMFAAAVFLGPILGPIVGEFVVNSSAGWKWVFWVIMLFAGTCCACSLLFLPETYPPVLLARKASRIRKSGNPNAYAAFEKSQDNSLHGILTRTVFRPFIMLSREPILVLVTLYMGLIYGLIYALFEVLPIVFVEIRGIKPTLSGLMFIGIGIGSSLGAAYTFYEGNKYAALVPKWRGFPPAEARLTGAMIGGPLLVVAIFWLGWAGAYSSVPWYVVELATIPLGCGIALVFISFMSYTVDTYLLYSASALAANSLIRSACGAAFPLFTNQMFHNLGVQWASTLLGGIALIMAPMPFAFYKYGAKVREYSKFAPCLDLKIKAEIEAEEKEKNTSIA